MAARRPFRFIAPMPAIAQPPARWRDAVKRLESTGFSSVAISDHVTHGWAMDPLVVMTAAAAATDRLRVLSLVLANDYRHPALVARAIATIDVLSEGRVELGLGAGWLADDYEALGLPLDPPAARIGRLEASVRLIRRLFESDAPVSIDEGPYRVRALEGLPRPVQRPGPPILIGGGGRRILSLAAREADIVGVNATLRTGPGRAAGVAGMTVAAVEARRGWIEAAAADAGRAPAALELQVSVLELHVTASRAEAERILGSLADETGLDQRAVEASPAVLVGSLERCIELLEERRERFGFSYVKLGPDPDAAAPLVARLAGR